MLSLVRFLIFLITGFAALPAHAHFGHLGELAGHGHGIAAGLAAAAALAALWLGKKQLETEEKEDEGSEAGGEAEPDNGDEPIAEGA